MSKELTVNSNSTSVVGTGSNRGLERANMEGISFPRTKIMQPTSPELSNDETLRMGDVINTLTLEKLPKTFIPLMVWDSNILFTPREDKPNDRNRLYQIGLTDDDFANNQILCRANDGKCGDRFGMCVKCGMHKFDNVHNTKPLCNGTVNVLALFEGLELPVIIQFAVTSYKHGAKFKQMLMFTGGDIFGKKYTLATEKKSQAGKTWFELVAKPAGRCTEPEFVNAEHMYNMFSGMSIVAEEEHPESHTQETESKEY